MLRLLPIVCALIAFVPAACERQAEPPPVVKPPDPELTLTKKVLEAGVCETRMRLSFSLKNKRQEALRIARWEATVQLNDKEPVVQEKSLELKLNSQDEATFDVPLAIDRGCGNHVKPDAQNVQPVDTVKIKGQVFATGIDDVIFEFEEAFELQSPKAPELVADLKGQKYDFGRVDMFLVLTLSNPNGFALLVENVTYKLKMGGEIVAQGEVLTTERVKDNSRSRIELPISLEPKGAITQELMKKGKIDYGVEATIFVAGSEQPYSKSGTFSF
jgi:LEA14-like dessication related protein